jgi:hypothetical protein
MIVGEGWEEIAAGIAAAALWDDVVLRPLAAPVPTRRIQAVVGDPARPGTRLLLDLTRETAAT